MRRAAIILIIFLLPLRAWVGDAMAMRMALPGGSAQAAIAQPAPHAGGVADCADHPAGAGSMQDEHCQTCTVCQTCHTLAIAVSPVRLGDMVAVALMPVSADRGFASADRALGRKPPIS